MSGNGVRTFLVIPDEHDGGPAWEGFVIAHNPEEACEMWRTHITSERSGFAFAPNGGDDPDAHWMVRELPKMIEFGAVPWEKISCTYWRAA